jgi:hypothetical protein
MMTDPTTNLDPLRQDLRRWRDKLKSEAVASATYEVLAALIGEASKLLREMENTAPILGACRQR